VILNVLLITCLFSIFGRSYTTLMPAFAKLVLHESSRTLGIMYAMPGLGTLLGGFALALVGDIRRKGTFVAVSGLLTAGMVFTLATSTSLLVILPLLIVVGAGTTAFNATVTTILQIRTPANLRGRVMSYNTMAWRGLTNLGGSVIGVMAEAFGIREAMAIGALLVVVSCLVLYLPVPHLRRADEEPGVTPLIQPAV
jgi:MFS family permease